jgi:hypothetical protein
MRLQRHLGWILPVVGLGVVGGYVHAVGKDRLMLALGTMGYRLGFLLALPIFLYVVHAIGWSFTLSPENRKSIGLLRMIILQTFSYGISGIVPFQVVVAEPLKMAILKDTDYDREDFAASLLLDNTINGFAIFAFVAGGLSYLGLSIHTSPWVMLVTLGLVALMVAAGLALIVVQKRGLFAGVLDLLARLPALRRFCERYRPQAERVDRTVRHFYEHNRRGFYLAFLIHLLERSYFVAEFWLIFKLIGLDVSWGSCFFIASVVNGLDNILVFIQVGGMETWISWLLSWMELTRDSINITAGLFRRLRIVFWAVVAVLLVPATRRLFVSPRPREQADPQAPTL